MFLISTPNHYWVDHVAIVDTPVPLSVSWLSVVWRLTSTLVQSMKDEMLMIVQRHLGSMQEVLTPRVSEAVSAAMQQQMLALNQQVAVQLQQQETKLMQANAGLAQNMQEVLTLLKTPQPGYPTQDTKPPPTPEPSARALLEVRQQIIVLFAHRYLLACVCSYPQAGPYQTEFKSNSLEDTNSLHIMWS